GIIETGWDCSRLHKVARIRPTALATRICGAGSQGLGNAAGQLALRDKDGRSSREGTSPGSACARKVDLSSDMRSCEAEDARTILSSALSRATPPSFCQNCCKCCVEFLLLIWHKNRTNRYLPPARSRANPCNTPRISGSLLHSVVLTRSN